MGRILAPGLAVLWALGPALAPVAAQPAPGADRPWIGVLLDVQYTSAPPPGEEAFRLLVAGIHEGGPGEAAGLRTGDRILSVNGLPVTFERWMRDYTRLTPGSTLRIEVARADGGTRDVTLVAQARPDTLRGQFVDEEIAMARSRVFRSLDSLLLLVTSNLRQHVPAGFSIQIRSGGAGGDSLPALAREVDARIQAVERVPLRSAGALRRTAVTGGMYAPVMAPYVAGDMFLFGGAQVRSVDGRLADYFEVERGVLVTRVVQGSLAAQVGFRPGDVIMSVGEQDTGSVGHLRAALAMATSPFDVRVVRRGEGLRLRFPGPGR